MMKIFSATRAGQYPEQMTNQRVNPQSKTTIESLLVSGGFFGVVGH